MAHFAKVTYFFGASSDYVGLVGPVTPFEIAFAVAIIVIPMIVGFISSATGSGQVTQYMILLTILVAIKKNILQFLLGVSWERAVLFHKCFGIASFVCACVHGIPRIQGQSGSQIMADTKLYSGLINLIVLGLQPFLYIFIKSTRFELFYYLHMCLYIVLIYFAVTHGALVVVYSIIPFAVDLMIRYALQTKRTTAVAQRQAGGIVKLSFDKKFAYRSGQYVFIMIPSLGAEEWHPFTISSAPHEEQVTLHIRPLGGWTNRLYNITEEGAVEVSLFVEGPHGLPSINLESDTYQIVVLISGAIGVTPHQSIANDLLYCREQGRPLKKLLYVWVLPENKVGMIESMAASGQLPANKTIRLQSFYEGSTNNSENGSAASGGRRTEDVEHQMAGTEDSEVLELELYCTQRISQQQSDSLSPSVARDSQQPSLSASASATGSMTRQSDAKQVSIPPLKQGRPDLIEVLARAKRYALAIGEKRVAVSVCGPPNLVSSAVDACRQTTSSEVQFDFHSEQFNL